MLPTMGFFYKLIRRGPISLAQNSPVKSGILRMASFSHPQMGILKTHCEFYDFYTKMELTKKIFCYFKKSQMSLCYKNAKQR